jgi:hypothetical protein
MNLLSQAAMCPKWFDDVQVGSYKELITPELESACVF